MQINTNIPWKLTVENEQIGGVNTFCYLGSYITKDGGADINVQQRIQKARQAYGMLNNIWKSSHISRNLKLRIFRSNVLSILLYGCETWKVTNNIVIKLQAFVNRCLRRIIKVFWPNAIENKDLWRRTNMEQLSIQIKRRKWGLIGHTLRRPEKNIARETLDWNPQRSRKRDRPKATWKRSIVKEARAEGKEWREVKALVQNKVRWRGFVDALCSQEEQRK